jgi:hypothetical protein
MPRTKWAICLGLTGNRQGSSIFMSLTTGNKIVRRNFTKMPVTDALHLSEDLVYMFQYSICLWILNHGWLMLYTIWLAQVFFKLTSIVVYQITMPWISTQPGFIYQSSYASQVLSKILLAVSSSLPSTVCLCNIG